MHIPDGYLGLRSSAAMFAAMVPIWVTAARQARPVVESRGAPALGLTAAFCFVVMLFNFPVPGGTTAHVLGAGLAGILVGPSAAIVAITVALAIQALLFGDGGLLAFPANCFNIACVMPVAAFAVHQLLSAGQCSQRRRALAGAAGAYVAVNLGALSTAVLLGLQPRFEPGHCPYGLSVTIPALLIPHLTVVGFVEAALTYGVLYALGSTALGPQTPVFQGTRVRLWQVLGGLCLISPLGLLAAGSAWGEWAPDELRRLTGSTPSGLAALSGTWSTWLAGYSMPGVPSGAIGYVPTRRRAAGSAAPAAAADTHSTTIRNTNRKIAFITGTSIRVF